MESMMNISALRGRVAAVVMSFGLMNAPACAGEVRAAVAANFTEPMARIVELFQKESGHTVKVSLGSTGKFYSQIANGAPFDVLVAADEKTPQRLEAEGLAVDGSRFVYAMGKLALWSAQPGLVDAKGAVLGKGAYNKLAIGDPKLVPYGMAAKEAMEKMGVWSAVRGKLVTGENITQTYQFAATGNADLAFVALSQILGNGKATEGSSWIVPAHLYNPIRQSAVQLSAAKDKAATQAFLAFLKGGKAVAIIRSFGYELP
jgi:molybdate transport system substrate-binding protein